MGNEICSEEQEIDIECLPEVIERRKALFNKLILPFTNMIYKLVKDYSASPQNVEENFSDVLINFYRRIETYDPNRSIRTWIHICTKRQVWASERLRNAHNNKDYDNDIEDYQDYFYDDEKVSYVMLNENNWREFYNDDIVNVLEELNPIHRDALILHEAGYSRKEIAQIEYEKGTMKEPNVDTIKSRLRVARQYLKNNINKNGTRISRKTDAEDVSYDSNEAD